MSSSKEQKIAELSLPEFMSPYRLAKFESVVRGKTVPPQKLYGYIRAGYLQGTENSTGKIQVAREEAVRYLKSQI